MPVPGEDGSSSEASILLWPDFLPEPAGCLHGEDLVDISNVFQHSFFLRWRRRWLQFHGLLKAAIVSFSLSWLEISVSQIAPGLPVIAAQLKRLFESFFCCLITFQFFSALHRS